MASSSRDTLRQASLAARQRQSRSHRLTRHTCFTMERPDVFEVNKSLVEYVDDELAEMHTSVFYQRIFILAKNASLEPEPPGVSEESSPEKKVPVVLAAVKDKAPAVPPDDITQMSDARTDGNSEANTEASGPGGRPSHPLPTDPEKEVVTNTFRFSEDGGLVADGEYEEMEEIEEELEKSEVSVKVKDFFDMFSDRLLELHSKSLEEAFTPDPVCGLFLYMDDYSLLMLEASEDMMGCFCRELLTCSDNFWLSNRVFMMEDHITQLYTRELTFRRIPGVFLNEKFPTSTPTDEYLMGKQHMIIKEKLFIICSLIAESLPPLSSSESEEEPRGSSNPASARTSNNPNADTATTAPTAASIVTAPAAPTAPLRSSAPSVHRVSNPPSALRLTREPGDGKEQESARNTLTNVAPSAVDTAIEESEQNVEYLPMDVYRKHLPEIQRIELVLSSTRFYYTLAEFQSLYGTAPRSPDEDGLFWPIQNNYTPPNIFRRTPYDINLTFANYSSDPTKSDQAKTETDERAEEQQEPEVVSENEKENENGEEAVTADNDNPQ